MFIVDSTTKCNTVVQRGFNLLVTNQYFPKQYSEKGTLLCAERNGLCRKKKAPCPGALSGLWQIRTVDLFRVKEAL